MHDHDDRLLERACRLLDLLVVLGSVVLVYFVRNWLATTTPGLKAATPSEEYVRLLVVFLPAWAWGAERAGLARVRTITGPLLDQLRALLGTQAWGTVAIALIVVVGRVSLNRSFIALFLAVSTLLLLVAKLVERIWVRDRRGRILALVVAPPAAAGLAAEAAGELERLRGRSVESFGSLEVARLRERLQAGGVDEVVFVGENGRERLSPLLRACEEAGVPALVRVEEVDLDLPAPRAELLGPALYLSFRRGNPDKPALLLKALADRLAAAAALVVLSPLLVLVAILVRLTSPGPALFVQQRGGLNGRPFPMLKFRTMRVGAEQERESLASANEMDGPVFKITNDPRVTPFGRFLRRTSLDELPQLLNVLVGQMSLVGPRPLPLVETRELAGVHRRRLSIRPGITCLWQVSGRNDLTFQEWMALDLDYVDNWSLGLDLVILLRTIPALLSTRGAK